LSPALAWRQRKPCCYSAYCGFGFPTAPRTDVARNVADAIDPTESKEMYQPVTPTVVEALRRIVGEGNLLVDNEALEP